MTAKAFDINTGLRKFQTNILRTADKHGRQNPIFS